MFLVSQTKGPLQGTGLVHRERDDRREVLVGNVRNRTSLATDPPFILSHFHLSHFHHLTSCMSRSFFVHYRRHHF
jgi:hypothetical protein